MYELIFWMSNVYVKFLGSGIPKLEKRIKKPSYALWRHKTELSQTVTS